MHKRRQTTVTGQEPSVDLTKKLNDMSHTQGDESDPDVVGVGEPKDPQMKAQDRGSQRTGKASMSLKMSQGASSSRFNNINREETEPEGVLELKDAIIELYLAIKIRSTEEVSSIAFKSSNTKPLGSNIK